MMTTTKTKKLHWTPDTPATMEMIEDYAGTFHTNETDDFIVAARNAAIAACKADLNALLTYDLPTKKPKTSVACYTMDEVMTKAISFYEGFIGGVAFTGKKIIAHMESMGYLLPKTYPNNAVAKAKTEEDVRSSPSV